MVKPEQHLWKLPKFFLKKTKPFLKLQVLVSCCTWLNILELWGEKRQAEDKPATSVLVLKLLMGFSLKGIK